MTREEAWEILEYSFWHHRENDLSITYEECKELLAQIKDTLNV